MPRTGKKLRWAHPEGRMNWQKVVEALRKRAQLIRAQAVLVGPNAESLVIMIDAMADALEEGLPTRRDAP